MGKGSGIEWTDHTFNPWWGCTKVSQACKNCYAEAQATRWKHAIWGPNAGRRFFGDKHWNEPLAWNRDAAREGQRKRVFCASMADVFEDREDLVPQRERLWKLIAETPWLDWLLLTKRPENVASMVPWGENWPSNVWLGTTVENAEMAEQRLPELIKHPAVVRFLSCEPLLGEVDLTPWISEIDWVIVGGEAGPKARPMDPRAARSLRDQCVAAGVAFHFKQWGNWGPASPSGDVKAKQIVLPSVDGEAEIVVTHLGKKNAGRELDGRTWDELPSGHQQRRPEGVARQEKEGAAVSTSGLLQRTMTIIHNNLGSRLPDTEPSPVVSRSMEDPVAESASEGAADDDDLGENNLADHGEVEEALGCGRGDADPLHVAEEATPHDTATKEMQMEAETQAVARVALSDQPGLADVAAQALTSVTREVAIRDIIIPPHRKADPAVVHELVLSIQRLRLFHPIILTPDLRLVAGRNRIAAFVELGRPTIAAHIDSWSKIEEELIEIDENLVRRRLTVLERGEQLARRKELYEAIHPETRQHVRGGHQKAVGPSTAEMISVAPAFAVDAATKLGVTDRTVREEIRIAKALAPDASAILKGTPFEDDKVRLTQLTRLPREQQPDVARLLVERQAKSVKAALSTLQGGTQKTEQPKQSAASAEADQDEQVLVTAITDGVGETPRAEPEPGPAPMNEQVEDTAAEAVIGVEFGQDAVRHMQAAENSMHEFCALKTHAGSLAERMAEKATMLALVRVEVEALLAQHSPNQASGPGLRSAEQRGQQDEGLDDEHDSSDDHRSSVA
ncbi:DUF5131 family protein [Polyangium aurulentum]|uniref:DUF5131 family protein n=1 Tax=Polyangium aurulentum TaxID=2567896 RepID=UPI0010AE1BC9|nr:DUF5131 family protein [Polyangium aurulentum]UQA57096.1 DUF5131 family protein [Polyangium aurulentum]